MVRLAYDGVFYDGQTPERHEVTVEVTSDGLMLVWPEDYSEHWPFDEITLQGGSFRDQPARFEHGPIPAAFVIVNDTTILRAIQTEAPYFATRFKTFEDRSKRRIRLAVMGVAALVAAITVYVKGIPAVAEFAASRVPREWEEQLGKNAISGLTDDDVICHDSSVNSSVNQIVAQLAEATDDSFNWSVQVVSVDVVNAFAAPGGFIVVFSGLLEETETPEELAGVLAHEMQHVVNHHGTKAIVRMIPLRLFMSALMGDAAIFSGAVETIGLMGILQYQRRDEEEADSDGVDLLIRAGINPAGMSDFFETMEEVGTDVPGFLQYMSTHPNTASRIERIDSLIGGQPPANSNPLLPEISWENVRGACSTYEKKNHVKSDS